MLVQKGYRYRIYPNKAQQALILRTFGCARYVYNYFLTVRREEYRERSKTLSYSATSAMLTVLKKDPGHIWLSEADRMALQEELRNLDRAYTNFFRNRVAFDDPASEFMLLAGFWNMFYESLRFVVLTTEANASVRSVHDRMPLILREDEARGWIEDLSEAQRLMKKEMPPLNRIAPFEQLSIF